MPKIKLIQVYNASKYCDYCDHDINNFLLDSASPWQEVSQDELNWLTRWEGKHYLTNRGILLVLEDVTEKTINYITDIKEFVAKEKAQEESRKKKELEKREKQKELAKRRKIEQAKKLLEKTGLKVFDSKD